MAEKYFTVYYENICLGKLLLNDKSNIFDIYNFLKNDKNFNNLSIESIAYVVSFIKINRYTNLWNQIKDTHTIKLVFNIGYQD